MELSPIALAAVLALAPAQEADPQAAAAPPAEEAAGESAGVQLFETAIRPLLAEHCTKCHGPKRQKSGLRLDSYAGALAGGERGPAIDRDDPGASRLLLAVRYTDPDLQMPPKTKLDADSIELLERWFALGAPGPDGELESRAAESGFDLEARLEHWSFQPVQDRAPPPVLDEGWPATDIDRFALARMEAAGVRPAPQTDRRTLVRRLFFDLTGLPPEPEVAEAFADAPGDVFAPGGAWDQLVERALASPHYAERWARHWLDLVRYAETRGHEYDFPIPNAWQYRDWVIRAFDADVPYDRFVVEHLAGDLVPDPRTNPETGGDESVLGTGFWYLGEEVHSPVDVRADQCDRIANQVDVLSKAFLGLSVACARCHDHKFDAITQADYYALCGFPLSTRYRQVRFETRLANARVAQRLTELRGRTRPKVRAALGTALAEPAARAGDYAAAAVEVLARGALEAPASELPDGDWIPRADLVFADFEGDDWDGWKVSGTAFGPRPMRADEVAEWQAVTGFRGRGLVDSHDARDGSDSPGADRKTGLLRSPEFTIERDFIHFLIGGGEHPGETALELVVDGEPVASATGEDSNHLRPERFDARPWHGERAFLRVVDGHEGSWGQVLVDHVVFSDRPGREALREERRPSEIAAWRARAAQVASERGLEAARVFAWSEAARRPGVLELLARVAGGQDPRPEAERDVRAAAGWRSALSQAQVVVDFGELSTGQWIQDGPSFGPRPRQAGELLMELDGGQPALILADRAGAWNDATWDVLERHPDSERDPSEVSWAQAGRTLHTPTFVLQHPRLWYLVRGSGHVFASVASHRMVHPPLHEAVVKSFAHPDSWHWVAQDLDYVGERVHLEFSPRDERVLDWGADRLAVALVVAAKPDWEPPPIVNARLADALCRVQGEGDALGEGVARALGALLEEGARRLGDGTLEGAPDAGDLAGLLDAWLAAPGLVDESDVAAAQREARAREVALASHIRRRSHWAPAALDGDGVDEYLLVRGGPHSPAAPVPRRFLEGLDGKAPLPAGFGSGRLALAQRIASPENPFTARVRVNRVWMHLMGRGLVPTPDDLGHMGQAPALPELLDWLAARFVEDGWSQKALIRRIVRSKVYRLSSTPLAESLERDPRNDLWHHRPVRRLEGEAIRDAMLAVSGDLDPTRFGPPVPVHLTDFLDGRGRPGRSGPLDGDGRRSLYLAVRRNFLVPFLQVFDAPAPATTRGRRSVSNVPAQALTLLNDPFVLDQARRWAERELAAGPASPEERVERLWRAALGRPPEEVELRQALAFVRARQQETAPGDPLPRAGATASGPSAAESREPSRTGAAAADPGPWADLCHVVFNLKEFIYLY